MNHGWRATFPAPEPLPDAAAGAILGKPSAPHFSGTISRDLPECKFLFKKASMTYFYFPCLTISQLFHLNNVKHDCFSFAFSFCAVCFCITLSYFNATKPRWSRGIFHLLHMLWHNHTEKAELYHGKIFHSLQVRTGFWFGILNIFKKYNIFSCIFGPCYAARPVIEMSDSS